MAKQDYIPKEIDALDTFFEVWENNIAETLTALSLDPTHADAAKTRVAATRAKFTTWMDSKSFAQRDSNLFYESLTTTMLTLRPLNQNLKTTPNYTPSIGKAIGIEGAEETPFDEANAKPKVKGLYEGGHVTLKFNKPRQVTSVEIKCKRGAETTFSYVADDTNSPYADNRANLETGKPESREYTLQFKNKDGKLIGQTSDVVKVMMP